MRQRLAVQGMKHRMACQKKEEEEEEKDERDEMRKVERKDRREKEKINIHQESASVLIAPSVSRST